jgi:acyl carrier protein
MNKEEISKKIKQTISKNLEISEDEIQNEVNFKDYSDIESMTILKIIIEIEDEFDMDIPTDSHILNIETLIDYIEEHL